MTLARLCVHFGLAERGDQALVLGGYVYGPPEAERRAPGTDIDSY